MMLPTLCALLLTMCLGMRGLEQTSEGNDGKMEQDSSKSANVPSTSWFGIGIPKGLPEVYKYDNKTSPDHTSWWQQGTVEKALAGQDKNATVFAQETVRTCYDETDKGNWKTVSYRFRISPSDPLNEMMFCITDAFKEKWKDFKWKALVAAGLVSQPMDYSYHYIELGWTDKNFYVYIWADPYGGWWRMPLHP